MKTIYLCQSKENVKRIYQTDDVTFDKADVMASPKDFADTEYLFSTWGMPTFTEEEIKNYFPSLKAVFYAAGSVQHFARPFLNCSVKVFSAWAANAVPVVEYTVAQITLANKGFFHALGIKNQDDYYCARDIAAEYTGNYGAKIGIIGAGMIGRQVIERLKAYKLELLTFDPFLSDQAANQLGVQKCSLERIFSECNVISNHLADNEQTRGMLGRELFSKMPPNSTFLNTGRGAQVVEAELIAHLKQRQDVIAILDVTHPEPPEAGSDLYTLKNCIITPHIAGSNGNEVQRMGEYMKEEFKLFAGNAKTRYEVMSEMLKTMA